MALWSLFIHVSHSVIPIIFIITYLWCYSLAIIGCEVNSSVRTYFVERLPASAARNKIAGFLLTCVNWASVNKLCNNLLLKL